MALQEKKRKEYVCTEQHGFDERKLPNQILIVLYIQMAASIARETICLEWLNKSSLALKKPRLF